MIFKRQKELSKLIDKLKDIEQEIGAAFCVIKKQSKNGGIIYTAGNGGSSSCSSHLSEELLGKYDKVRPPIKSICLSSSSDLLTCIANDFKFKNVFARQIEGLCEKNDVLVLFTTSGNSKNLIYAINMALAKETPVVVFSGKGGGQINELFKDKINQIIIPSDNGGLIQEIHLSLIHSLVEYLEAE